MPGVRVVLHQVPDDRPRADVTIGFGIVSENSRRRVPGAPQNNTTFIVSISRNRIRRRAAPHETSPACSERRRSLVDRLERQARALRNLEQAARPVGLVEHPQQGQVAVGGLSCALTGAIESALAELRLAARRRIDRRRSRSIAPRMRSTTSTLRERLADR